MAATQLLVALLSPSPHPHHPTQHTLYMAHIVAIYLAQGNKMSIISHLIYRFPFCVKGRKLFQAAGQGRAGQKNKLRKMPKKVST